MVAIYQIDFCAPLKIRHQYNTVLILSKTGDIHMKRAGSSIGKLFIASLLLISFEHPAFSSSEDRSKERRPRQGDRIVLQVIKPPQPLLNNQVLIIETNALFGSNIDINALVVHSPAYDPACGSECEPIGTYAAFVEATSGNIYDRFNLREGSILVRSSLADFFQPAQILPFIYGDKNLLTLDGILNNAATASIPVIVNGTGIYEGAVGQARLSGMVNLSGPLAAGTFLSEDCLWVIAPKCFDQTEKR